MFITEFEPPCAVLSGCEILTARSETSSETFPPSPRPARDASEQALNRQEQRHISGCLVDSVDMEGRKPTVPIGLAQLSEISS